MLAYSCKSLRLKIQIFNNPWRDLQVVALHLLLYLFLHITLRIFLLSLLLLSCLRSVEKVTNLLFAFAKLLNKLIHFFSSELGRRVVSWVQTALQDLNIFLLISNQRSIWRIANADIEAKGVIGMQKSIVEIWYWYKLIVSPALSDIESRAILPNDRFLSWE